MIGFFTDPLRDELLYSACARYHERAGYRSRESTGSDLFGEARAKVAVDLPCNLATLLATFPPGHRHTADSFIDRHTLLPLYAPFVPPERVRLLREDMRGDRGSSIHGRLGVLTSNIEVEFLRYCPACVEEDRGRFVTYWHRLHQAPGVAVCPTHKVFLEDSRLHTRNRDNGEAFVTAERAVGAVTPRRIDESDRGHRALLRIANDVNWLLGRPDLSGDQHTHRDRYVGLLTNAGFSTPSGEVRTGDVVRAVSDHYSPEFLESLGCGIDGKKYCWIHRLVHNHGRAQHPLQHLLLMQFLDRRAEDFFGLPPRPPDPHPFGEGPWPCLNRAADHYGQPVITECEISRSYHLKSTRGTFRCGCGFVYSRFDRPGDSRDVMGWRVAYGKVWEDKLKEMFKEGRPLKEIGASLGISAPVAQSQAARLGLLPSSENSEVMGGGEAVKKDLRDKHRRAWLEARESYPKAGRTELVVKFRTPYNWLRQNDREWLEQNSPARRASKGPPVYVDWRKRDVEFSEAARKEAERLKNEPGRPVRVTATGVAKAIGCLAMTSKRGDLLPLTVRTLSEMSESVEEAAIRRVNWAAKCYREEGIRPPKWELWKRAGMSGDVAARPEVAAAIDAAILSIHPPERATAKIQ